MQFRKEDFEKAAALWAEWNEKINVVSRKDTGCLYEHHILHSLAIAEYLSRFHGFDGSRVWKVLDVGCGGGFPGIPLAMVMPSSSFTLCDSIGKKIKVAAAVAEELGLGNVSCVNARAETLPGGYDWIVSRAVTALDNFYPWVKGKYSRGILCLKGGDVREEIAVLCRKCGVNESSVRVWAVSEWLEDEYFAEKFVIEIGKN